MATPTASAVGKYVLLLTSLFCGMTMIMGLNAINAAPSFMMKYYSYLKGGMEVLPRYPTFWDQILTIYSIITLVTQMFLEVSNLSQFMCRFSLLFRLEASIVIMTVEVLVILIMPHTGTSEVAAVVGMVVVAFIGGVGRAYFENTSYALFSPCPSQYLTLVLIGSSFCGTFVSVIQVVLKVCMGEEHDSLLTQSVIYFAIAIGIMAVCSALLIGLLYNSHAKKYIAEMRSRRSAWANIYQPISREALAEDGSSEATERGEALGAILQSDEPPHATDRRNDPFDAAEAQKLKAEQDADKAQKADEVASGQADGTVQSSEDGVTSAELLQKARMWPVMKKVWPMMFSCFLTFFLNCLLYPGVLVNADKDDYWYPTCVMLVYNVCDMVGRFAAMWKRLWPSRRIVFIVALARIGIVPLMVLCRIKVIPSHEAAYVIAGFLSLTSGFFGTLTVVLTASTPSLKTDGERGLASQATGACLLIGCACGILLQLALELAVQKYDN